MLIKEYRVILPLTVEEFRIGQLYAVAEASKTETGGGDGVEVIINDPFDTTVYSPNPPLLNDDPRYQTGQYTDKFYHMAHKVPTFIRAFVPSSALVFNEKAWNAYPYCRTVLTNSYMNDKCHITIESMHVDSNIFLDNVHQLTEEQLKEREVVYIDIAEYGPQDPDYKKEDDPTIFKSTKTGRGPLQPGWWKDQYDGPLMCAYKLVACEFKWWGLQGRIERLIHKQERRLFAYLHRQVFLSIDKWHGMTMEDIRHIEDETKKLLEEQRLKSAFRGHVANE